MFYKMVKYGAATILTISLIGIIVLTFILEGGLLIYALNLLNITSVEITYYNSFIVGLAVNIITGTLSIGNNE